MITTAFLNAENDEWGAIFREKAESLKETHLMYKPEDYILVQQKWRNPDLLLEEYNSMLNKTTGSDYDEERVGIISPFSQYYFNPEWKNIEIADVFIFAFENDPNTDMKLIALDHLGILALNGIEKAVNFIKTNLNNRAYDEKVRIMFHLQNLTIENDEVSIQYLLQVIDESQNIKTLDVKYGSKYEVNIVWYIAKVLLQKRYESNLEYDYVLPILKQLMFSQTKNVQTVAVRAYYKLTNKTEMRKIYDNCWAKVQNNNTPREEYIDALYGLQALYELRDIGKYSMGFKGILTYFATLGGKKPIKNGFEYIELTDESRILKTEKQYFQRRLRSK
jgi:hypothetical protein